MRGDRTGSGRCSLRAQVRVICLAGPPFGGALMGRVAERLGGRAVGVLDPAHPDHGWVERAEALAEAVRPGEVVVAHGLAVPAAVRLATLVPVGGLVLSNGPLRPTGVTRALSLAGRRSGVALVSVFRPPISTAVLASSAGLRRLVVNPYVMDRDTVAALSEPLLGTPTGRRAVASYLASLATLPDPHALRCPTLLAWGDADPIFGATEAAFLEATLSGCRSVRIPGGQHLHPEERPWALADAVAGWRTDHGS